MSLRPWLWCYAHGTSGVQAFLVLQDIAGYLVFYSFYFIFVVVVGVEKS